MAGTIDTVLDRPETLSAGIYNTWCRGIQPIRPPLPDEPLARAHEIGHLLAQRAKEPYTFLYDIPYLEHEQELAFEVLGYRPDNVVSIRRSA